MAAPVCPVLPADFKALIPTSTTPLSRQIANLIKLLVLFHRWYAYKYNFDGSFTDNFKAEICSASCFNTTTTTT